MAAGADDVTGFVPEHECERRRPCCSIAGNAPAGQSGRSFGVTRLESLRACPAETT
jgi:hypothetical protein